MFTIFEFVPAHILIALSVSFICVIVEFIDTMKISPSARQRGSVTLWKGEFDEADSQRPAFSGEKVKNKKEFAKRADKIRLLHIRITIFSIIYSVFSLNVYLLGTMLFDAELGELQVITIVTPVALFVTWAAEDVVRFISKL